MRSKQWVALVFSGAGLTLSLPASAAETYKFTLHNNSQYAISGFQTYENKTWTSWTGVKAGPGQEIDMDWNTDSGECKVPFRILYRDVETEQYTVDWCKISNIYVSDDKVTAD